MTTLTTAPLRQLLDDLFAESDASQATLKQRLAGMDRDEVRLLMTSTTGYGSLYARMKDVPLAVARQTGLLFYMLVRSTGARSIFEFGTSFGISTLHLAAALRDNGDGQLITSEFEPSKVVRARQNLAAGGLGDLVEIREGDALETLSRDIPQTIDLILLDGAKGLYPAILSLLKDRLRIDGLIVANNADWVPEYLSQVRASERGYLSVALADDLELSMKVGSPGVVGSAP